MRRASYTYTYCMVGCSSMINKSYLQSKGYGNCARRDPRAGFSAAWRGYFPHRSTARRQQQTREHQDGSTMQCETLIKLFKRKQANRSVPRAKLTSRFEGNLMYASFLGSILTYLFKSSKIYQHLIFHPRKMELVKKARIFRKMSKTRTSANYKFK